MIKRKKNIPISAEVLGGGLVITFNSGEMKAYPRECLPDPWLAEQIIFRNGFTQRFHKNGTGDSYCLFCIARVGSSRRASLLRQAEALHNCWQKEELNSSEERSTAAIDLEKAAHSLLTALGFGLLVPLSLADHLLTTAILFLTQSRSQRPRRFAPELSQEPEYRRLARRSNALGA